MHLPPLIGIVFWIAIVIVVSLMNRKKAKAAPPPKKAGAPGGGRPSLQEILRDLARQMGESGQSTADPEPEAVEPEPEEPSTPTPASEREPEPGRRRDVVRRHIESTRHEAKAAAREELERQMSTARAHDSDAVAEQYRPARSRIGALPAAASSEGRDSAFASRARVADTDTIRDAVVWAEVLGKPLALRDDSDRVAK